MIGVLRKKKVLVAPQKLVVPDTFRDYYDGVLSVIEKLEAFANEQQRTYAELAKIKDVPKGPRKVAERTAENARERLELVRFQAGTIGRALQAGFEPTQPPQNWYCGFLNSRDAKWLASGFGETWPSRNEAGGHWPVRQRKVLVFQRPIPTPALKAAAMAESIFGGKNIRVYSPIQDDFVVEPRPLPRDPIIIGCVALDGEDHFFEISHWEIAEDLRVLWESVAQ